MGDLQRIGLVGPALAASAGSVLWFSNSQRNSAHFEVAKEGLPAPIAPKPKSASPGCTAGPNLFILAISSIESMSFNKALACRFRDPD
jgi:hypothetical protein